jgi:hypothetical protein
MVIAAAWVWLALGQSASVRALAPVHHRHDRHDANDRHAGAAASDRADASDRAATSEARADAAHSGERSGADTSKAHSGELSGADPSKAHSGELASADTDASDPVSELAVDLEEPNIELPYGVCGSSAGAPALAAVRGNALPHSAPHSRLAPRALDDESQPAWCMAPDDPRCAPRDVGASTESSRIPLPPPPAADQFGLRLRPAEAVASPHVLQLGAACSGVHVRLERPPRHGRRVR